MVFSYQTDIVIHDLHPAGDWLDNVPRRERRYGFRGQAETICYLLKCGRGRIFGFGRGAQSSFLIVVVVESRTPRAWAEMDADDASLGSEFCREFIRSVIGEFRIEVPQPLMAGNYRIFAVFDHLLPHGVR